MIQRAVRADVPSLVAMEACCFAGDRMSSRSFYYMVDHPQNRLLVYRHKGKIIGYILTFYHTRSKLARHYSLAVLPEFHGKGIAQKLLAAAEKYTAGKTGFKLELRQDNDVALHVYQKLGYKPRRIMPAYYADGMDAIEMVKTR